MGCHFHDLLWHSEEWRKRLKLKPKLFFLTSCLPNYQPSQQLPITIFKHKHNHHPLLHFRINGFSQCLVTCSALASLFGSALCRGLSTSKTPQHSLNIYFPSRRMWINLCLSANKCRYVAYLTCVFVYIRMHLGADGQTCSSPQAWQDKCALSTSHLNRFETDRSVKSSEGNKKQCV